MLEKLKQALLYGKDFCEDTAENLKETVVTAVDASKLRYRITSQRNELNAMYALLGRSSYAEKNGLADWELNEDERERLCDRIKLKSELLSGLEKQYRMVCGRVICPECGKFISEKHSFCPFCGRAMSKSTDYYENDADVSDDELGILREIDEI